MNPASHQLIIQKHFDKLINEEGFTQIELFQKLQLLDFNISKSSISNLRNNKPNIKLPLLKKAMDGLSIILERECCLFYNKELDNFEKIANCRLRPINKQNTTHHTENPKQGYKIYEGRIDLAKKVDLYNHAKEEIIEIGIRLRSFRFYFSSRRDSAFEKPLIQRLQDGVNIKCYIMDHEGAWIKRYINDRSNAQPFEQDVLKNIDQISTDLKNIFTQINSENYSGKLALYKYNHFPYYHASIADGDSERGLIYLSPYLYGVTRANSPVIEISKKKNKTLYKRYWQSIKAFINAPQTSQIV